MKKLLALILSVTMVLSLLTGLSLSASAETTTVPSGTVTLTDLTEGAVLPWVVTHSTSSTFAQYSDNAMTLTVDGFENATIIQTKRYETGNEPWKTLYKGKTSEAVANITVNNSCEVYVFATMEARNECGKWISDQKYEYVGEITASNGIVRHAYKKQISLYDGQTATIPLGTMNSNWSNQMCSYAVKWTENVAAPAKYAYIDGVATDTATLGWQVKNGLSSSAFNPYYDHIMTLDVEALDDYSLIQTKRYEPSGEPWKTLYKSNVSGTVANLNVNNSCEIYVFFPLEASSSCGKWISEHGYTSAGTVVSSNSVTYYIYKRTVKLIDGATAAIPLGTVNSNWFNQMCSYAVKWIDNPVSGNLTVTNNNNTNWQVVNNTSITGKTTDLTYTNETKYYKNLNGYEFDNVSYIKTFSQYEPANEPYKTLYKGKTYHTIETMSVDNSCEIYILTKNTVNENNMQWISNYGFEAQADTVILSNNTELNVYKKTCYLNDGENCRIPLGAVNSNQSNQAYTVIVKWIDNPTTLIPKVTFTTLGDNAEYYTVTENAHIGERITVGGTRKVMDFGKSELEGAYVLKPFSSDVSDPDFSYSQKPEDESLIKDSNFYTVTLNKSATVYIATSGKQVSSYMEWLNDWTLVTDDEGSDVTINIQNDSGSYNQNWYLYKKTFKVPAGETRTINLKNAKLYATDMYIPFFKFTDEELYSVNLNVIGEGLKPQDEPISDLFSGESVTVKLNHEDGYYFKSVKADGEVIAENIWNETVEYTVPSVTKDVNVEIEMDLDTNYPLPEFLECKTVAFSSKGESPVIIGDRVYPLNVIGFAIAKEKLGANVRGEFGMLVSLEKPESIDEMVVTNENLAKAAAEGSNAKGQYGIRLYGEKAQKGQKCYLRAYAFYGNTVIYGNEVIEAEF